MSGAVEIDHINLGVLHDAELVGLTYESIKTIRLAFLTDTGAHVYVVLRDVCRFVANNLLDGNIVLDASSTKFQNLRLESVDDIVKQAFPGEFVTEPPNRALASNRQWEKWLDQIRRGDLHVFVIEPSYGAEVVAICGDIEINGG